MARIVQNMLQDKKDNIERYLSISINFENKKDRKRASNWLELALAKEQALINIKEIYGLTKSTK